MAPREEAPLTDENEGDSPESSPEATASGATRLGQWASLSLAYWLLVPTLALAGFGVQVLLASNMYSGLGLFFVLGALPVPAGLCAFAFFNAIRGESKPSFAAHASAILGAVVAYGVAYVLLEPYFRV